MYAHQYFIATFVMTNKYNHNVLLHIQFEWSPEYLK